MWLLKSASPSEAGSAGDQMNINISNESRQSFDSEEDRLVQTSGNIETTYSMNIQRV